MTDEEIETMKARNRELEKRNTSLERENAVLANEVKAQRDTVLMVQSQLRTLREEVARQGQ